MRKYFIFLMFGIAALAGCAKEVEPETVVESDGIQVTATAIAPGAAQETKVVYTDEYSELEPKIDITAEWEAEDSFTALEINGGAITVVSFVTDGEGSVAEFKSVSEVVEPTDDTKWVAVNGDVDVDDAFNFICRYSGQNGSLEDLGDYDYVVAQATGKTPSFDFSKGTRLSYVMRVILPAGIKYIEFNTGETNNGGWTVTSDGKTRGTTSTPVKDAVSVLELEEESIADQVAYLAIPAIRYNIGDGDTKNRLGGLIVTIMSENKKLSQGKTYSEDLTSFGGRTGTFKMNNLELLNRPLASEAIDLGSVTYESSEYPLGAWAPYNLGADIPDSEAGTNGGMFAWGETEPKTSFTREGYKYYNEGTYVTQLGEKVNTFEEAVDPFIEYWPSGESDYTSGMNTFVFYDIQGTKYDAARVKWGSEWCLPGNEIINNITKQNNHFLNSDVDVDNLVVNQYYAPGTYKNSYGFTSGRACWTVTANDKTVDFYCGNFTIEGKLKEDGTMCRYWTSTSDYGTTSNYWNRSVQLRITNSWIYPNNHSYQWDGLQIRPVLNK